MVRLDRGRDVGGYAVTLPSPPVDRDFVPARLGEASARGGPRHTEPAVLRTRLLEPGPEAGGGHDDVGPQELTVPRQQIISGQAIHVRDHRRPAGTQSCLVV